MGFYGISCIQNFWRVKFLKSFKRVQLIFFDSEKTLTETVNHETYKINSLFKKCIGISVSLEKNVNWQGENTSATKKFEKQKWATKDKKNPKPLTSSLTYKLNMNEL